MILLGTEFRDTLLTELDEAAKIIPYGGEQTFLKKVRDLINSPQYNFFIPEDKNTQLFNSVAMTEELIKLCELNGKDWGDQSKITPPIDATGWGRSFFSLAASFSSVLSTSVKKAVFKILQQERFGRAALIASDFAACKDAEQLLKQPEYANNPNSEATKALKKFWLEQNIITLQDAFTNDVLNRVNFAESNLDVSELAAEILGMPKYAKNPRSDESKAIQKFWSKQLQLKTAEKQTKSYEQKEKEIKALPKAKVPAIEEAERLKALELQNENLRRQRKLALRSAKVRHIETQTGDIELMPLNNNQPDELLAFREFNGMVNTPAAGTLSEEQPTINAITEDLSKSCQTVDEQIIQSIIGSSELKIPTFQIDPRFEGFLKKLSVSTYEPPKENHDKPLFQFMLARKYHKTLEVFPGDVEPLVNHSNVGIAASLKPAFSHASLNFKDIVVPSSGEESVPKKARLKK